MEYLIEKESKVKKLSSEDKSHIASRIVRDFKTYNDSRQSNLVKANELIAEVFF